MALAAKEEKKKYLKSIASKGRTGKGRAGTAYLKYADIDPKDVHEGASTYRGFTVQDSGPLVAYSRSVSRGEGKNYFIWRGPNIGAQGQLYKSGIGGANPVKVTT